MQVDSGICRYIQVNVGQSKAVRYLQSSQAPDRLIFICPGFEWPLGSRTVSGRTANLKSGRRPAGPLWKTAQDRIGLHPTIYRSRAMSAGDGGCRPGTVKVLSPADTGHPAVILMLGQDEQLWCHPVRPGKIWDGDVENTGCMVINMTMSHDFSSA